MSKTPIEMMLDGLTWVPVPDSEIHEDGTYPYATHSGEMDFMGHKLRCYRLSDGRAVINADDLSAFLGLSRFLGE